jgi:hypothetical protein
MVKNFHQKCVACIATGRLQLLLVVKKWIGKIRSLFVTADRQITPQEESTGPKETSQSQSIFAAIVEPLMQPLMNLYPKKEREFSEVDLPELEEILKKLGSEREFLEVLVEGLTKVSRNECIETKLEIHEQLTIAKSVHILYSKITKIQMDMINLQLRRLSIVSKDFNPIAFTPNEDEKLV